MALHWRLVPVFPALREPVMPHEGECVFPAARGARGAQRSLSDVRNPVERVFSILTKPIQVVTAQALPMIGRVAERSEVGWVVLSFKSKVAQTLSDLRVR